MDSIKTMIELKGIQKSYKTGETKLEVLKGIDLSIQSGEMVSIMGSSGSGKSTLLNIIGLLDQFDHGEYYLNGKSMRDIHENQAAEYRNRYLGFVFQSFNLLPFKNATENVALPLYYRGIKRKERLEQALDILNLVGLSDRADHLPSQLSGGQQQRVAIARALVTEPKVILADEPTGALDTQTGLAIMDLFHKVNQNGMTILIVTHENEVAEKTNKIIQIRDGKIISDV